MPFAALHAVGPRPWRSRALASTAALGLLLGLAVPGAVHAQAPTEPLGGFTQTLLPDTSPTRAPSFALGVWTSRPGESKLAFVRRMGAVLERFTGATDFEGCGRLLKERDGDRWRMPLTTNHSHIGCKNVFWHDPAFEDINESLHSHPKRTTVRINDADFALFAGGVVSPKAYVGVHPEQFSPADFHSGPGYVVAPSNQMFGRTHLLFQSGEHQVQDLGKLEQDWSHEDLQADATPPVDLRPLSLQERLVAQGVATPPDTDTIAVPVQRLTVRNKP